MTGNEWNKLRALIKDRDGFRCRICFRGLEEGLTLDVHHINWERADNSKVNLVTLCRTCHKQVHDERYKPAEQPDWPVPWVLD